MTTQAAPPGGDRAAPGSRLPSAPRERKPALAALAVLLILVGALGSTMLVLRAGDRVEAVKVTKRVPAGQKIPESAISPVMVADDGSVNYVRYEQRGLLRSKYRTKTDLVPGTVLVGGMLTEKSGLEDGKVVVGLSLSRGQYPPQLKPGDTVAAYRVGQEGSTTQQDAQEGGDTGQGGGGDNGPVGGSDVVLAAKAKVQSVKKPDDGSFSADLPVSLQVKKGEAAALTTAASAGLVSLVIVPASSAG